MAVPEVRAVGAKAQGKTTEVEVGAPAGIAVGDLEILIASTEVGGTVTISANGGGAWTAMGETPIDVTAGEKLYVWTRKRAEGDGNPKVKAATNHICAGRIAIKTGTFDPETPTEVAKAGSEATSDTSFVFKPEKETAGINRLCFVVCSSNVDSETGQAGTNTANSSLTSIVLDCEYQTKEEGGGGFWCAHGLRATKGTVGEWTQTMTAASPKAYVSFAVNPKPPSTIEGAAELTGTGSSTAAGKTTRSSTAALSGTGTSQASGTRLAVSSAALSGSGSLSSSGTRQAQGKAALSGSGTLSATGGRTAIGSASLGGTGSLNAAGTRTAFGTAALSGTGTLSAVGIRQAMGAADLSAAGSLSADGLRVAYGVATLSGQGLLVVAEPGEGALVEGSADLSGQGSLAAQGTRLAVTSATLIGTGTLTAAGGSQETEAVLTIHDSAITLTLSSTAPTVLLSGSAIGTQLSDKTRYALTIGDEET